MSNYPALCNGELDLIVNLLSPLQTVEGLISEPLREDRYVVIASKAHRLAGREHVSLAELARERWSTSERALHSQQKLLEVFRDAGLQPPLIALDCRAPGLRLQTVAQSDLLDWTTHRFVSLSPWAEKIEVLPVKELTLPRTIGIVYRRETYQAPALKLLISILKRTMTEDNTT